MAKPDWQAIESVYRAGLMPLSEIKPPAQHQQGTIRMRDDWSRDIQTKE